MIENSEIKEEVLNEIVKNYKYEEIENLKLCIIEMKKRGKSLNQNYLNQISKYFKVENSEKLYSVENLSTLIDTTSSTKKKSYYLKFKISTISLIIINYVLNIFLAENQSEIQSETRRLIIGGYIGYQILNYFLKSNYSKVKDKYNPFVYALGLFLIIVLIQTILMLIFTFFWSKYFIV